MEPLLDEVVVRELPFAGLGVAPLLVVLVVFTGGGGNGGRGLGFATSWLVGRISRMTNISIAIETEPMMIGPCWLRFDFFLTRRGGAAACVSLLVGVVAPVDGIGFAESAVVDAVTRGLVAMGGTADGLS